MRRVSGITASRRGAISPEIGESLRFKVSRQPLAELQPITFPFPESVLDFLSTVSVSRASTCQLFFSLPAFEVESLVVLSGYGRGTEVGQGDFTIFIRLHRFTQHSHLLAGNRPQQLSEPTHQVETRPVRTTSSEMQQQQSTQRAQCIEMIKTNPHLLSLTGEELKNLGLSDQLVSRWPLSIFAEGLSGLLQAHTV